jgi:hypothetical protein
LSTKLVATTTGCLVVGRCPVCVPAVLGEDCNPQGERSRLEYRDPKKRDGGGTSSRRDGGG